MDYNTGYQYSVTGVNVNTSGGTINVQPTTTTNSIDGVTSTWTGLQVGSQNWRLVDPGAGFQFTETYSGPGLSNQTIIQRDNYRIGNRYYKYILSVIGYGILSASPAFSNTVGGVSATANPVANSSGSVTNQAIQVLQGPYITNTYGGGIQCQGPTLNFTPYVTGSVSASKPYEPYFDDPVYDVTDNFGAFDEDGNAIGDGILDNPGDVVFFKKQEQDKKITTIYQ